MRAFALSLVALVGCAELAGLGDFQDEASGGGSQTTGGQSSGGGGSGGGGAGGEVDTCATCLDEAPMGWLGPVLVQTGDSPQTACAAGWSDKEVLGMGEPNLDNCACNCEPATGETCTVAANLSQFKATTTCREDNGLILAGFSCTSANIGPVDVIANPITPSGGQCSSSGPTLPPAFSAFATVCRAPDVGACEGGVCRPPIGSEALVCIHQSGDVPTCPPDGPYTDQRIVAAAFLDHRQCGACLCEAPAGGECNGMETQFFSSPNCLGSPLVSISHPSGCEALDTYGSYRLDASGLTQSPGTCGPAGGELAENVETTEVVTLCCAGAP